MNRFVVIALLCILLLSCAARADGITTEAPDVTATDVSTDVSADPLTSSAAPQETTLTPTDTSNALDTSSSPASATSTSSSPTATAATASTASPGPTPAISLSPTAATAQAPTTAPPTTTNGITVSPPTAATTTTATSTQAPTAPSTIPPPPATTSTMAPPPPPPTPNVVTTPAPSAGRVLLLIATAVNGSLISTPPLFAVAIAQCTETDVTLIGTFSYTDLDPDQSRNFTFFVRSSDDSQQQQPSRAATEELLRKATSSHRRTCANRGIVNVRADGIDEAEAMEDEGSIVGWVIAVVVVVLSIVVFLVFSVRRERAIEASRRQLKALVEMELAPAPPIGDLSRLGLGNDTINNNDDDDNDDDAGPRLGVDETPLLVPLIAASTPGDPATALPAAAAAERAAPHDEALLLPPATATAEDASAPPSHYEPVSLPDAPPAVSAPPLPSEDVAQVSASEAEAAEPTDDLRDETIDANCAATPATAVDLDGTNGGNAGNDDATGVLSALPDPTTDPNL